MRNLLRQRIEREIRRRLTDGAPRLAEVAAALGTAPWTLQRRLAETGIAFSEIVDATRRDLAGHYLRQPQMPLSDIALCLGYSEQSAFTRAHRRWFGIPPRGNRYSASSTEAMQAASSTASICSGDKKRSA
jgi:AraC-like DNA-binding protein